MSIFRIINIAVFIGSTILVNFGVSHAAFWAQADGSLSCERVCQKKNALAVPAPMGDSGIFSARYTCAVNGILSYEVGSVIKLVLTPKFRCRAFYEISTSGVMGIKKIEKPNFKCLCD